MIIKFKYYFITLVQHKSFQGFFIIALLSLFQIISQLILGIHLSKEEFGKFSFIFSNLMKYLPLILTLGLDNSFFHFFSSEPMEKYNWKRLLGIYFLFISLVNFLISGLIVHLYHFPFFWILIITCSFSIATISQITAVLFASQKSFNQSHFLSRFHILFFLAGIILYLFLTSKHLALSFVLYSKCISLAIAFSITLFFIAKFKSGLSPLPMQIFKKSLYLWVIACLNIIFYAYDFFSLSYIFDFEQVGNFNILYLIIQIYFFSSISFKYVFVHTISNSKYFNIKKRTIELVLIALIFGIFIFYTTPWLLKLFFNEKYQIKNTATVLFCLFGSFELLHTIPSSIIVGQKRQYAKLSILFLLIFMILSKIVCIHILTFSSLEYFILMMAVFNILKFLGLMFLLRGWDAT